MIKLNIGCGDYPAEGYINIDKINFGHNKIYDVRLGLKYKDNEVDEIEAKHFLEHLTNDEAIDFLNECHRVLKPEGIIRIVVPSIRSDGAFIFQHKSYYNPYNFYDLEREDREKIYGIKKWKVIKVVENKRKDIHAHLKPIK